MACCVQVQKLFAGNFESADAFRKHAASLAQVIHLGLHPLPQPCLCHINRYWLQPSGNTRRDDAMQQAPWSEQLLARPA